MRAALLLASACTHRPAMSHDGYVWQRVWTDSVRDGVRDAGRILDGFRVNAAAVGAGGVVVHDVDLTALAATHRPVRAVVRVDAGVRPDPDALSTLLVDLARRWRAAGVDLVGVELDHDCATAALAGYAQAVRSVRASLPADLRLSITALPTWSSSDRLDELLAAADEVVLQVHAVDAPGRGLFDRDRARAAVDAYAGRAEHLWVAVPAYGMRLREPSMRDLRVDPAAVVGFLGDLDPAEVDGVGWFRVPTADDPEVWPLAAIAAADRGEVPRGRVEVQVRPGPEGVFDLTLANDGLAWVPAPERVEVQGPCTTGDALGAWELDRGSVLSFVAPAGAPLDPGRPVPLGWVRCPSLPTVVIR